MAGISGNGEGASVNRPYLGIAVAFKSNRKLGSQ